MAGSNLCTLVLAGGAWRSVRLYFSKERAAVKLEMRACASSSYRSFVFTLSKF